MSQTCDKCGIMLDTDEAMIMHMKEAHPLDPADVHSVSKK
jgi:hypothetical protein